MRTIYATTFALALLCALTVSGRSQSGDIYGIWLTDDGKATVRIAACGSSACGYINWLRNPKGADGRRVLDRHNPDPSRRTRPICGLQIIGGLKQQADRTWDLGWIYDPKVGSTYSLALSLKDANTLSVLGYMKARFLGKTYYWTRTRDARKCK